MKLYRKQVKPTHYILACGYVSLYIVIEKKISVTVSYIVYIGKGCICDNEHLFIVTYTTLSGQMMGVEGTCNNILLGGPAQIFSF